MQYISKMDDANFKDMKKYNPGFSEKQVEGKTDEEIREMFKDYYAKHLPVDLLTWMRVYEPSNTMLFNQGYWDQTVFVRDEINRIFYPKYEDCEANPVKVISTHMSKSIVLPVYYIFLKAYDTKIILRHNFYDWKVSVDSACDIDGVDDFFQERVAISPVYCEGFADNQVYGMYKDDHKRFTVELSSNFHRLYTFFYMMKKSLSCSSVLSNIKTSK